MNRRQLATTDSSGYSLADSIKELAIRVFTNDELAAAKPEQILSRMLSTKSAISTTSSLAEDYEAAQSDPASRKFFEVGKGQCGTVYALQGDIKLAKLPNSEAKLEQLFIDYQTHVHIIGCLAELDENDKPGIKVPQLFMWATPESTTFWARCGLLFPHNVDAKSYALVTERIFPVPLPVREALVDALCPPVIKKNKRQFLAKPENKSCLIRLYLGRRDTTKSRARSENFKLQNFPLHINEMESLQLDTALFAETMAKTLAFLHWKAGIDGNDIEFVLGSSPEPVVKHPVANVWDLDMLEAGRYYNFKHRSLNVWLIDFNQCARMEANPAGVQKAVNSFLWNDPYYPRPNSTNENDQKLWKIFREQYLQASRNFTATDAPQRFIATVEEKTGKGTVDGLFA